MIGVETLAIIRGKKPNQGYYILSNVTAEDDRLSLAALGLLVFLLSRPDDWIISETHLRNKWNVGRDKLRNLLNELVEAGYAQKTQARDTGKFDRNDWIISESPFTENPSTVPPSTEKPLTEKPSTENPTLTKYLDIPSTDLNNKSPQAEKPTKPVRRRKPESWKQFFAEYPGDKKGGNDQTAWNKAKSLKLTDKDFEVMLTDVIERKRLRPSWRDTYAQGICKYLAEEIWKTPIVPEVPQSQQQPRPPGPQREGRGKLLADVYASQQGAH